MFWYSDCVVTGNEIVSVDIYTHFVPAIGSDIHIFKDGQIVYTGVFDSQHKHIDLLPMQAQMEYYTIVISSKDKKIKHSLPFTAMKLESSDSYIICDIDFTISATNALLYMMRRIVGLKTIGNSMEVLTRLSKKYKIIYVTGRIERYTKMSHLWIENNGYPMGPILARPKEYPLKLASFKTEILNKITAISKKGIGIGDLKSDILAYLATGIVPIKIKHPFNYYKCKITDYKYNDKYYLAKSWYGIEKMFEEKKFFLE